MSKTFEHLDAHAEDHVLVISLQTSEVTDYNVAESIGRELIAAVEDSGIARVALDMSQVRFISSVGYMPLLGLNRRCRELGGSVALFQLSSEVREVFDATRMLINPRSQKSVFLWADTKEQAIELLMGSSSSA